MVHRDFAGSLGFCHDGWKIGLKVKDGKITKSLYNLNDDVSETKDLAKVFPEKLQSLQDQLAKVIKEGRSTPGLSQKNEGPAIWEQISWMK
jgi:hypothetical protein